MTGMIDSHHHVWDPQRDRHAWLDGLPSINRAFGADDLAPLAAAAGVDGTVLVQVLASVEETREFLIIADRHPLVRGVVGWVDLTAPDVADVLADLTAGPGGRHLVGIRHLVQDEPDVAWLGQESVGRGIAAVGAAGLVYDLLLKPAHLASAEQLVANHPDVRFVVDHLAKPDIAGGGLAAWEPGFRALAAHPNVACKVSGILTEAGDDLSVEALLPYVSVAVEAFGPDRLMIGSDWPVSLLATDYVACLSRLTETLTAAGLTESDLTAVHATTAETWYRLP